MNTKTLASIIIVLILLVSIPVTIFVVKQNAEIRKRAAPATTLTLAATPTNPGNGENITVNVNVDTAENRVIATELYITFDPTKLEAKDIVAGAFFPQAQTVGKLVDNTNGKLNLSVFLPPEPPAEFKTGKSGTGTVAIATFTAIGDGATTIRLTDQTLVGAYAEGGKNVLIGKTPATVTIGGGGGTTTQTPTPTPTGSSGTNSPTPTRTPTPTPTGTGGTSGTNTPTPTPTGSGGTSGTNTPTPTRTPTPTPTPTGSGGSSTVLAVTSPASGSTVTTSTPTIRGTSKANSTVTIVIQDTQPVTGVVAAGSTGSWSYTPTSALTEGSHAMTITEQAPDGTTNTISATFTVQTQGVPVTGAAETTLLLLILGFGFLIVGVGFPMNLRSRMSNFPDYQEQEIPPQPPASD